MAPDDIPWLGEPRHVVRYRRGQLAFFCPGCGTVHMVTVASTATDTPRWGWNGSYDLPTLSPSILTWVPNPVAPEDRTHRRCHAFLRNGQLEFLPDCHHALAGQTVPLAPFPL